MTQPKPNLTEDLKKIFKFFQVLALDPCAQVIYGFKEKSIPLLELVGFGIILSQLHYWGGLRYFLSRTHIEIPYFSNYVTGIFGALLVISGFYFWGFRQMVLRSKLIGKLHKSFFQAGIETRLKETPHFIFDYPVGAVSRKLRVKSSGIAIDEFRKNKLALESSMNINISKIENPNGNRELIDIIYATEKMPEYWLLDNLMAYKNFSFPIGKTVDGEIKSDLLKVPHYLIAGETNSGKSTLIRSIVMVLTMNNNDLQTYFIDLKGEMDGQVFHDFDKVQVLSEPSFIDEKLSEIESILNARMAEAKKKRVKNISEFNSAQKEYDKRWDRILIVVDEIAELMPTVQSGNKATLAKIQSRLNRFSRIGRSVGIHLIIGVQKPDHKNLDATIKANLPGVICFPVSHFSQSVLVLGNGHAADLNAAIPGRAIWKYGSNEIEVQAPFLSNEEIKKAQEKKTNYFTEKNITVEGKNVEVEEDQSTSGPFKSGN